MEGVIWAEHKRPTVPSGRNWAGVHAGPTFPWRHTHPDASGPSKVIVNTSTSEETSNAMQTMSFLFIGAKHAIVCSLALLSQHTAPVVQNINFTQSLQSNHIHKLYKDREISTTIYKKELNVAD